MPHKSTPRNLTSFKANYASPDHFAFGKLPFRQRQITRALRIHSIKVKALLVRLTGNYKRWKSYAGHWQLAKATLCCGENLSRTRLDEDRNQPFGITGMTIFDGDSGDQVTLAVPLVVLA